MESVTQLVSDKRERVDQEAGSADAAYCYDSKAHTPQRVAREFWETQYIKQMTFRCRKILKCKV